VANHFEKVNKIRDQQKPKNLEECKPLTQPYLEYLYIATCFHPKGSSQATYYKT